MKKHLLILSVFMLAGCATVYLPESNALRDLKYSPVGDCVVKAQRGHVALLRAGEQSRIACGFVGTSGTFQAHCWVEVYNEPDDQWHLFDLSSVGVLDGWPVAMYKDYSAEAYWYRIPSIVEVRENINPDQQISTAAALVKLPVARGSTNAVFKVMTAQLSGPEALADHNRADGFMANNALLGISVP